MTSSSLHLNSRCSIPHHSSHGLENWAQMFIMLRRSWLWRMLRLHIVNNLVLGLLDFLFSFISVEHGFSESLPLLERIMSRGWDLIGVLALTRVFCCSLKLWQCNILKSTSAYLSGYLRQLFLFFFRVVSDFEFFLNDFPIERESLLVFDTDQLHARVVPRVLHGVRARVVVR